MFNVIARNGGFDVGSEHNKARLKKWLRENEGQRIEIKMLLPESGKLRRWYHGALIPLACYYTDNLDYRDHKDRAKMHAWLKCEFNGEVVVVNSKPHRISKTTAGKLKEYVERVMDWMGENGADLTILETSLYKKYMDEIYPYTFYETFLDYLIDIGRLPSKTI